MFKILTKRIKKIGLPPGTLVHVGERKIEQAKISLTDYDKEHLQEIADVSVDDCVPFKDKPTVTWINVIGVHQADIIEQLGRNFGFHTLLLEDIMNTGTRPKIEDYDDHLFIVLKMFYYDKENDAIREEQISFIIGQNFVITFQESEPDVFIPVRDRIRNGKGKIRKLGPDYLAYALLDLVIDSYFVILEKIGEALEEIEEELISEPVPETLQTIYSMKRDMIFLRKSIWPSREVVNVLIREEQQLISDDIELYLRDVYDHTIQIIEIIESYRDVLSGMVDIYLSSVSNKMNEIMKVLTIIATIFIPITFIAGIYGMNFKYMPELEWSGSYFVVWGVFIAVILVMISYFRKKKWL